MLSSGTMERVSRANLDEDADSEEVAHVAILVQNILPPFLDGRITFTKQFEPVIPLKVCWNSTASCHVVSFNVYSYPVV